MKLVSFFRKIGALTALGLWFATAGAPLVARGQETALASRPAAGTEDVKSGALMMTSPSPRARYSIDWRIWSPETRNKRPRG